MFVWMGQNKFYSLEISKIQRKTKDCITITFLIPSELSDVFRFKAGQYLTLRKQIENVDVRRSYSICSIPDSGEITIGIKKVEGGLFSSYAHTQLKKGDKIDVMPPAGNFTVNPKHKNLLFFASGSGITPVFSQISDILRHTHDATVTLVYGNKNFESIIFREEIEALKNKFFNRIAVHHIFSKEKTGIPLYYGRIDADKCKAMSKVLFNIEDTDGFMICGPNDMIFNVKDALIELGVPEEKIHFELFSTKGLKSSFAERKPQNETDESHKSEISVQMDGDIFEFTVAYSGDNLLDAAIAHGADLPYSCKGGVCSTCKAKITEGKVEMDLNYALEPYELDAGYVLLCQSHPRSAKVFIDFDQK